MLRLFNSILSSYYHIIFHPLWRFLERIAMIFTAVMAILMFIMAIIAAIISWRQTNLQASQIDMEQQLQYQLILRDPEKNIAMRLTALNALIFLAEKNEVRANLRWAQLEKAQLYDLDLSQADLRDANLKDAKFRNVVLLNADLREADLRGANLRDGDFKDKNSKGVKGFQGTQWKGAWYDSLTRLPEGLNPAKAGMQRANQ